MRKPLTPENQNDANDVRNVFNADKGPTPSNLYSQINPAHPTGLVPPPPDAYYDVPAQMRKPLTPENQNDANDIRNVFNANKGPTPSNFYSQINPAHPTGLVPPPPDAYYDVPAQMRKPLTPENQNDANDIRNVFNANKGPTPSNLYAQMNLQTEDSNKVVATV
jgi:uncharacterized ParB-like nuclease family protein